jgi:hypothetical protein
MKKAHQLTGILALLALCACTSNQGSTMGGPGGASSTPGTPPAATAPPPGPATTDTTPGQTPPPATANTEGRGQTDCSNVRCMACPTGQHPALTPPDCCRCVPG